MEALARLKTLGTPLRAHLMSWINRHSKNHMVVYRPESHYVFNRFPDFPELFEGWLAGNMPRNSGDLTRFYTLYLNVDKILRDGVPGDVVELGVYKGNSAVLLAQLARRYQRQLYLFDTFYGFDSSDLRGLDKDKSVEFADTSLPAVQSLVGTENITYVPGLFPASLSQVPMFDHIAAAHIDCDLYEPIRAGLEYFYPRLSPGGVLVLHDYSSGFWPGATRAIDEFFAPLPEKPILVADKSGTAIIRKASPCE